MKVTAKELKRLHDIRSKMHAYRQFGMWHFEDDAALQLFQLTKKEGNKGQKFFQNLILKYVGQDADTEAYEIKHDTGEIVLKEEKK